MRDPQTRKAPWLGKRRSTAPVRAREKNKEDQLRLPPTGILTQGPGWMHAPGACVGARAAQGPAPWFGAMAVTNDTKFSCLSGESL